MSLTIPLMPQSPTRSYDFDVFFGIFAPAFLASLNAIAMACFLFLTFARPPDFKDPSLYSSITFLTLPFPADLEVFFWRIGAHGVQHLIYFMPACSFSIWFKWERKVGKVLLANALTSGSVASLLSFSNSATSSL